MLVPMLVLPVPSETSLKDVDKAADRSPTSRASAIMSATDAVLVDEDTAAFRLAAVTTEETTSLSIKAAVVAADEIVEEMTVSDISDVASAKDAITVDEAAAVT